MKETLDRLRRYDGQSKLTSHLDALDAVYPGTEFGYALSVYTTDLHKAADELLRLTDPTLIDEAWLDTCKAFSRGGMSYTAIGGGEKGDATMEVELMLMDFGWAISLLQGVPDDPNVRDDHVSLTMLAGTRGELRSLARLLKIDLKEQA